MDRAALLEQLNKWYQVVLNRVVEDILIIENSVEAAVVLVAFAVSYFAGNSVSAWLRSIRDKTFLSERWRPLSRLITAASNLALPIIWVSLQFLTAFIFRQIGYPFGLLSITISLLTAWIIIRLASHFVRNPAFAPFIAATAWTIAALNILGLLEETQAFLESLSFSLGAIDVTALAVINSLIALIILLWLASLISRLIEQQMHAATSLTPSIRVLVSNLSRISLFIIAIIVALGGAGIDLTALTVFSGAVGIGVGFGLQKIISNFISGIILLLDKSVKPGDIIVVGDTFGWIEQLNARYVSVNTRNGAEHLIPNEDLIVNRVENWSHSNPFLRIRIPIGISYNSDVRKAIELCIEAASESKRVVKNPEPTCLVLGFGDSSIDLDLRIWIGDPQNGRANITSECLLKIWDKFHHHNIEIPYPQRDLHIRSTDDEVTPSFGQKKRPLN